MINKFLAWFVVSSANPNEFSATLKGFLVANIAIIMYFIHLANLSLTTEQVVEIIGCASGFVGAVMLGFGLVRKIFYTIKPK